jgi:hypothetical protein
MVPQSLMHRSELCAGRHPYEDVQEHQQELEHGFKYEKPVKQWHGPDPTMKGQKEVMRVE